MPDTRRHSARARRFCGRQRNRSNRRRRRRNSLRRTWRARPARSSDHEPGRASGEIARTGRRLSAATLLCRRFSLCGARPLARRSPTWGLLFRHPVHLHAKIDQLGAQGVETCFEIPDVALRWDVDEVKNTLDVAVEALLVGEETFTSASEPLTQAIAGHHFIEKTRRAVF